MSVHLHRAAAPPNPAWHPGMQDPAIPPLPTTSVAFPPGSEPQKMMAGGFCGCFFHEKPTNDGLFVLPFMGTVCRVSCTFSLHAAQLHRSTNPNSEEIKLDLGDARSPKRAGNKAPNQCGVGMDDTPEEFTATQSIFIRSFLQAHTCPVC